MGCLIDKQTKELWGSKKERACCRYTQCDKHPHEYICNKFARCICIIHLDNILISVIRVLIFHFLKTDFVLLKYKTYTNLLNHLHFFMPGISGKPADEL